MAHSDIWWAHQVLMFHCHEFWSGVFMAMKIPWKFGDHNASYFIIKMLGKFMAMKISQIEICQWTAHVHEINFYNPWVTSYVLRASDENQRLVSVTWTTVLCNKKNTLNILKYIILYHLYIRGQNLCLVVHVCSKY